MILYMKSIHGGEYVCSQYCTVGEFILISFVFVLDKGFIAQGCTLIFRDRPKYSVEPLFLSRYPNMELLWKRGIGLLNVPYWFNGTSQLRSTLADGP